MHVLQVGPRSTEPGGMQSVIASYPALEQVVSDVQFTYVTSYTAKGRRHLVRTFFHALFVLATLKTEDIDVAQVHMSQRGSVLRAWIMVNILRMKQLPIILTIHGSRFRDSVLRYDRLVGAIVRRVDAITVLSQASKDAIKARWPSVPVTIVPNFVTVGAVNISPPSSSMRILYAGRCDRRKGLDVLLRAWDQVRDIVPEAELLVAGPSGDVPVPSIPGIHHLGVVPSSQIRDLLEEARAGVLPSRAEAMPMFILETMATGRPVVTTDIEDLARVVDGGGLIVTPGALTELVGALVRLMTDGALADRLGSQARRRVEGHFTAEAVAGKLVDVYRGAVERSR